MRFGPREKLDALARAWTMTAFGMLVLAIVAAVSERSHADVVGRAWNELAPAIERVTAFVG